MATLWLLRSCDDGGTDYVCFRPQKDVVEILEGYHLPPQMPFIKRRHRVRPADATHRLNSLERREGFRHGAPLF